MTERGRSGSKRYAIIGSPGRRGSPAAEEVTVTEGEGKRQRLRKLRKDRRVAEVLFLAAMSGDVAAIKEISDRLDGKVTQTHDGNVSGAMNVTVVFGDD